MEKKYSSDLKTGKIKEASDEERENLRIKYNFASNEEKPNIAAEMAEYGMYVYEPFDSQNNNISILSCGSGDVYINAPSIIYEAMPNVWVVSCGGNWKNDNWNTGVNWLTGDVGGEDAFGVGYTSISGSYISHVVSSYAKMWDQYGDNYSISTTNRSDGDGSKGFGFRLQDKRFTQFNFYRGYYWYGSCTYATGFGSYDGIATAYYTHTYSSANITGVEFGINGENAGVKVTVSIVSQAFTAYGSDTPS